MITEIARSEYNYIVTEKKGDKEGWLVNLHPKAKNVLPEKGKMLVDAFLKFGYFEKIAPIEGAELDKLLDDAGIKIPR